MKAMTLLVAVFALSTQGCAAMISEMSTVPNERPSVAAGMGGVSSGRYAPVSVPSNLPLPIQADPRTRMAVPNQKSMGRPTYATLMGVYSVIACLGPIGMSTAEEEKGCDDKAVRDFQRNIREPAAKKGPVILR